MKPVVLAALCAMSVPALAQAPTGLPTERVLPLSTADDAARAALAACQAQGWRVSVAVVDRGGTLRVLLRGDGAGPHTVSSAGRKAFTAASLRASTLVFAENIGKDPAQAGLRNMDDRILFVGGGLPIRAGDDVVGGIGVGGAPGGDKDESCAKAGLDRIADQLR